MPRIVSPKSPVRTKIRVRGAPSRSRRRWVALRSTHPTANFLVVFLYAILNSNLQSEHTNKSIWNLAFEYCLEFGARTFRRAANNNLPERRLSFRARPIPRNPMNPQTSARFRASAKRQAGYLVIFLSPLAPLFFFSVLRVLMQPGSPCSRPARQVHARDALRGPRKISGSACTLPARSMHANVVSPSANNKPSRNTSYLCSIFTMLLPTTVVRSVNTSS